MGEVAEMTVDGTLCEGCGVYLGESVGHPRRCSYCRKDQRVGGRLDGTHAHHRATKTNCPQCGKRVKIAGIADHIRDAHGEVK